MKLFQGEIVTDSIKAAPCMGYRDGRWFRCHICGKSFQVGDGFRAIYSNFVGSPFDGNPLVCWRPACTEFGDVEVLEKLADMAAASPRWLRAAATDPR